MATEEMVMEYTEKRRGDLEDLCKFNIAAGVCVCVVWVNKLPTCIYNPWHPTRAGVPQLMVHMASLLLPWALALKHRTWQQLHSIPRSCTHITSCPAGCLGSLLGIETGPLS